MYNAAVPRVPLGIRSPTSHARLYMYYAPSAPGGVHVRVAYLQRGPRCLSHQASGVPPVTPLRIYATRTETAPQQPGRGAVRRLEPSAGHELEQQAQLVGVAVRDDVFADVA